MTKLHGRNGAAAHRKGRSRAPQRPVLIVTFLALLLSLFGPGLAASAQGDAAGAPSVQETEAATEVITGAPASFQGTETSTVVATDEPAVEAVEATESPTVEGTDEPTVAAVEGTESPTVEATDEPPAPTGQADAGDQDPQAASLPITKTDTSGAIEVVTYTCPPDYGIAADFSTYITDCRDPAAPYTASVTDYGTFTRSQSTVPQAGGAYQSATFTDVPSSIEVLLEQAVPSGYAEPAVRCTTAGVPMLQGIANTVPMVLGEGQLVTCEFVNFPPATEGDPGGEPETSSLTLTVRRCPSGFDPATDVFADCIITEDGVPFALSGPGGALAGTTGDDGPGATRFGAIAPGTYDIVMTPPTDAASVFAWSCPKIGVPSGIRTTPMASGASLTLTVDAGSAYACQWYVVPAGGDGTDPAGTVHVSKYTCPEGVERSEDHYALSEQCREDVAPVSFTVLATAGGYEQTVTADPGVPQSATFSDVPYGEIVIEETVPVGYGHPLVFCADTAADGPGAYVPVEPWPESGAFIVDHRAEADIPLSCIVFNFPGGDPGDPGNTLTVNKYTCPSWANPEVDILIDACAPGGDGIAFELVDGNGRHPAAVTGGTASWNDVWIAPEGELQIIETIPDGYGDPIVVCDGVRMNAANGFVVPNPPDVRPFHVTCDWFNIALEDAALAVIKHTCAPGYDLHAAAADPMTDCPELTDGVPFHIGGAGADMTSTTGDAGTGMVQFGGLDPGSYTVTETIPPGTASSFVLDCYGNDIGAVRPYPLATGDSRYLTVHAAERVTCHWFNVPEAPGGEVTLIKYICTGDAYVSEVDCQILEDGVTFDLVRRSDGAWVTVDTATTDGHGTISWVGLEPGRYWLDERDGDWCHIASGRMDTEETGIIVELGHEAVVAVYNCGAEPGQPGKTPTTFPDTGVPPKGEEAGGPVSIPAVALASLMAMPLSRRRLVALAVALSGASVVGHAAAQEGGPVIEPADGTAGPEVARTSLCLPSPDGGCERGPVPAAVRIDAIGVAAPVEILETVAGEMQQPTDERHVAWYKETARLGEPGNMLLAGHLNWWGVPEAVFYNLASLAEGDAIVVEDGDGLGWSYAVQWVRQVGASEVPGEDVLGLTSGSAVTLITCGGEWDSASSAYDARTVVRATLVERA